MQPIALLGAFSLALLLSSQARSDVYEFYSTANGTVMQRIVRFETVSVGEATARAVRGSISDSLEVGLLGTSFLKKFSTRSAAIP